VNGDPNDVSRVQQKIRETIPNVQITPTYAEDRQTCNFVVAPVENFVALVQNLEFGGVTIGEGALRRITIRLMPTLSSMPAPPSFDANGMVAAHQQIQKTIEDQMREIKRATERMMPGVHAQTPTGLNAQGNAPLEKIPDPPKRSDPDYFEKMLDRLRSTNRVVTSQAVDALAEADPTQVKNPETRKQITREFQRIAFDSRFLDQEKAVRGLYTWGGKHAASLLLKLLPHADSSAQRRIVEILADLQDERAVAALVTMLNGGWENRRTAKDALIQMGSLAETAVLDVVASSDPDVCLSAIEVLSQIGTEESLPKLRRALQSKNSDVREKADLAIRLIRLRAKAAEKTGKES
jgi:predicted outer membrane protein